MLTLIGILIVVVGFLFRVNPLLVVTCAGLATGLASGRDPLAVVAAFPVMTAGIGLPRVVHRFGGDVTVVAAVGMLSGFCGTVMTPMAANFNIVPAALLEQRAQNAVVKVQIPTGLLLLSANTALMYLFAFPH